MLLAAGLLAAIPFAWGDTGAAAPVAQALFTSTLTGLDGKPAALEQYRGKPLIVNFWARWCGPCRQEIPELAKMHGEYARKGLVVLGIGLEDKPEAVQDFARAYDMNYPILLARDQGIPLMQALGNVKAGLPFTVVIDRQGRILSHKLGVMKRPDLEAAVAALLK
ncbi:MAG: TlpA family protein disulfide reductase [Rhodocyclaceae bacterium]|nr:TlpA family protein disulfide reductase [Rhodocyclaceae bacterium]